jgi:hypothetical protein
MLEALRRIGDLVVDTYNRLDRQNVSARRKPDLSQRREEALSQAMSRVKGAAELPVARAVLGWHGGIVDYKSVVIVVNRRLEHTR